MGTSLHTPTLENLENVENEKINFQVWKSPGRKKIMKMSWKSPGNPLKIDTKLELISFLEDLYPRKHFLPQIIVLEILILTLKSLGQSLKKGYEKCRNPDKVIDLILSHTLSQ